MGGLHEFMGWQRADHHRLGRLPGVLDGPRLGGRRDQAPPRHARSRGCSSIEEEGVRFRAYTRRLGAVHGPRDLDGDPGRAGLGHRAGLRRVHALPRGPRLHARARWSAPTAGSTAAWPGTREHAPEGQALYGIVQGGVDEDLRAESAAYVAGAGCAGIAIGGSLGQEKAQMREVLGWSLRDLPERAAAPSARDRGRRRHRARRGRRASTRSTAPRPRGWRATARRWCPTPSERWRLDLTKAAPARQPRAARGGVPVRGVREPHAAATCTTCRAAAS